MNIRNVRRPRLLQRKLPGVFGVVAGLALLVAPLTAEAVKLQGTLKGTKTLLNPAWQEARDPDSHSYTFREPVGTVPAKLRVLSAYLPKEVAVVGLAETRQESPPMTVVISGGRIAPSTIVVPPGTQLTFKNADPFAHELYAVGQDTLGPSQTQAGGDRKWTVPDKGVYEVRDKRSPSVRLWIVSEPRAAAMTTPDTKGDFALDLAEPGTYQVQVYFAGKLVGSAPDLVVGARDVDLRKKPIDVTQKAAGAPGATPAKEQK